MRLADTAASAATAILAHLFAVDPGPAPEKAALYSRATALAFDACRLGPWDELRDLAVIARNDALAAATPAEVRKAALGFLGVLEQPQAADGLVAAALAMDGNPSPALGALLGAAGPQAIWALCQRIAANPPSPSIQQLKEFVARLGQATWRRAAEIAPAYAENDALAFLMVAATLPRRLARETMQALTVHPDAKVRAMTNAVLAGMREPAEGQA